MKLTEFIEKLVALREAGLGDARVVTMQIQWGEVAEAEVDDVHEAKSEYKSEERVVLIHAD